MPGFLPSLPSTKARGTYLDKIKASVGASKTAFTKTAFTEAGYKFCDLPPPEGRFYAPMIDSDSGKDIAAAGKWLKTRFNGVYDDIELWCIPEYPDMAHAVMTGKTNAAQQLYKVFYDYLRIKNGDNPNNVRNRAVCVHNHYSADLLAMAAIRSGNERAMDTLFSTFYKDPYHDPSILDKLWVFDDRQVLIARVLATLSRVDTSKTRLQGAISHMCVLANLKPNRLCDRLRVAKRFGAA